MDWMRRQDVKEEPQEAPLTPEDDDECYFEEDEGMVREISRCASFDLRPARDSVVSLISIDVLISR